MEKEKKNYSKTLNLPETSFSMKANLSQKEKEILEFWEKNEVYERSNEREKEFVFHDGPPYANGEIHIGTALNKILKDTFLKYKRLRGYKAKFIPGWDTHGLPIELKIVDRLDHSQDEISVRKKCRNYALSQIEKQKKDFKALGVLADWENHYMTLDKNFISNQMKMFSEFVKKGYVFYGLKPVYWSVGCETALAEAEIEYKEKESFSIYVKFKLIDNKKFKYENVNIVIWTTTPWTLPANVGIAVNPNLDYSLIEVNKEFLIIASDLVENFVKELSTKDYKELEKFKGTDLEFLKAEHPFIDRDSLIILGDHVTLDAGTGCVHTAPGHGQEDYIVGKKYNLPILCPIDERGIFTKEAGKFANLFYEDANLKIIEELEKNNRLLKASKITHSYPFCWRSKTPIIFRATRQCFIDIEKSDLRDKCLEALKQVEFIPASSSNRMNSMLKNRPDWCISRQRIWGVPIPVIFNKETNEPLLREDIVLKIAEIVKEKDLYYYLETPLSELLKDLNIDSEKYYKGKDIMDVWLDSGVVHYAAYQGKKADFYLEGTDQHRAWFQVSLITSIAHKNETPYKKLITHGFVVDGNGLKMSKSLGNTISPQEIIKESGADILRLWVASVDCVTDVKISKEIINQIIDNYRKIRNTIRFALGNLYDFELKNIVKYEDLLEVDKVAMGRLKILNNSLLEAYDNFELEKVYYKMINFISTEMSSFYFDILKDRLYTSDKDSFERRSGQTVLLNILINVTKLLSPILSFTMEEIWQHLKEKRWVEENSILETSLEILTDLKDKETEWILLNNLKNSANKLLEKARSEKLINSSLEAIVKLYTEDQNLKKLISSYNLEELFIVSKVEHSEINEEFVESEIKNLKIKIEKYNAHKCLRCWKYYKNLENEDLCKKCLKIVQNQI